MDAFTAKLHLFKENAEVAETDSNDYFVWLVNKGVSPELLHTLQPLWETTRRVGGKVIYLGKIIIDKLVTFISEHPHAAIGAAIGAGLGALSFTVPLIGPVIGPVLTVAGSICGVTFGARLDYGYDSKIDALIRVAKDFFAFLADIFNTLKKELFGGLNG